MENNRSKSDDKNRGLTSHNKTNQHNSNKRDSGQEQQSHTNRRNKSAQEGSGDKYLSNGYLDDKERYDDTEL